MLLAVKDIHEQLDKMAQPVKGKLKQIATISTESEELGEVIAKTMEKIGQDGIVTVETSNSFGITSEIAEGLELDKGYISPYMVNNERLEAEYKDIPVFISERKIGLFKEIQPIMDSLVKKGEKDFKPDMPEAFQREFNQREIIRSTLTHLDDEDLVYCIVYFNKCKYFSLCITSHGGQSDSSNQNLKSLPI